MRNPFGRFLVPTSVVLLAAALAFVNVPASAMYHTLNIVILVPEDTISIGERVTLTVHILNAGIQVEPSSILADLNRNRPNQRVLTPVRIDVGLYQIQFDLQNNDIVTGGPRATVEATVGDLKDADWVTLALGGLEVEVVSSVVRALPGETVNVTVRSSASGAPLDVNSLFVAADVFTVGHPVRTTVLDPRRIVQGTYQAWFTVPTDLSQESTVAFFARAGDGARIGSGVAYVLIGVPSDVIVWYRELSVGPDSAVLEILVSNTTGSPVANAAVALDYLFYTAWSPVLRQVTGTTSARGAARLDLDFPEADSVVYFSGTVGSGVARQGFSGRLLLTQPEFAPPFDVLRDNPFQFATPRETSSVALVAKSEGVALPNQAIYYTARTPSELIASGTVISDGEGRFELAFAPPPGNVRIEFASNIRGVWAYDALYVPSARPLHIEIGNLVVGGHARVRAALPSDHRVWMGLIALLPYERATGSLRYPWAPASGTWGFYQLVVVDRLVLEHDILLPRFLPKNVDYLLYVSLIPQGTSGIPPDPYLHMRSVRIPNAAPTLTGQVTPNPVQAGSPISADASLAQDPDGALTGYRFDWGDGTFSDWSAETTASHRYDQAGRYFLVMSVRDDTGAVANSIHVIQVEAARDDLRPVFLAALVVGLGAAATSAVLIAAHRKRSRSR